MSALTVSELENEVVTELTVELKDEDSFNADLLRIKVKNAVRELRMKRNYTATSMTDEQILTDMYNYYSVILNVARYDYNQVGVEGEQSHSENSVSRTWVSRDDLFKGVHAFVNVF